MTDSQTDPAAEKSRLLARVDRERNARLQAEAVAERGMRQLYERQQQLEVLHGIAETANASISIDACLKMTLDQWCRYTGWPVGHFYLVSEESPDRLVSAGAWHTATADRFAAFRETSEATTFERGTGLPGRVMETGRAVWVVDVTEWPGFLRGRDGVQLNVRGAFAFPVLLGSETVAVAEFFSEQPEEVNEGWLNLATQLGTMLGRVFERLRAQREIERSHQLLLRASREAGMAEVANGVLHNVGNVLTSLNLIVQTAQERAAASRVSHLQRAVEMMQREAPRLGEFITNDPKGRELPAFLARLAEILSAENARLRADLGNLARHGEHIREIVVTQQGASHALGKIETLDPAQLFEDALRLNADSINRHGIRLERSFSAVGRVQADRHRVLQILVNLLHNAKDALMAVERAKRGIRVSITPGDAATVSLAVADNGVGIAPEVREKIFQHGFTTKPDGHGFGLHSAALAAREMHGRLTLGSDGVGRGATFTLTLPLARPEKP